MASVTIRFPDDIHNAVTDAAKRHRRSFNGEVLWLLEQGLAKAGICPATNDDGTRCSRDDSLEGHGAGYHEAALPNGYSSWRITEADRRRWAAR